MKFAIGYSRFSSELQREESIDAQVRAIKSCCEQNGYILLATYSDRGISGTNAEKRPEFQKMIARATEGGVDAVIVHKLDRFARNRYDAAIYKNLLKKHNVRLISVLENFNDDPESIILESVIEGMNEYYSANLSREVRKGLQENALQCKATGGPPPLGYSVDPITKKFVLNEREAEAVRLIFEMYLEDHSYTEIITTLNSRGYKTRRGADFAKNSLYEILRNERYTGVYIYVKDTTKNPKGKYVRHGGAYDLTSVIRISGGMPEIISREKFDKVQQQMTARRHKVAKFSAKQEYLLSGKVFCGECSSPFAGNSRKPNPTHPLYVSYKCTRRNQRDSKCRNPEINRDKLESAVLQRLSSVLFDPRVIPSLVCEYNAYIAEKSGSTKHELDSLKKELAQLDYKISKTMDLMIDTGSAALKNKLEEFEASKAKLLFELSRLEVELKSEQYSEEQVRALFQSAENQLRNGTLANRRAVIDQYIEKVVVHPEKIEVYLKVMGDYERKETINIK